MSLKASGLLAVGASLSPARPRSGSHTWLAATMLVSAAPKKSCQGKELQFIQKSSEKPAHA